MPPQAGIDGGPTPLKFSDCSNRMLAQSPKVCPVLGCVACCKSEVAVQHRSLLGRHGRPQPGGSLLEMLIDRQPEGQQWRKRRPLVQSSSLLSIRPLQNSNCLGGQRRSTGPGPIGAHLFQPPCVAVEGRAIDQVLNKWESKATQPMLWKELPHRSKDVLHGAGTRRTPGKRQP